MTNYTHKQNESRCSQSSDS